MIEDLIKIADILCKSLDTLSNEDRFFNEIGQNLENMSREAHKISQNLQEIKSIK